MDIRTIDRSKTFYYNDFLKEYLETDKLDELRSFKPDLREIPKVIAGRKGFSQPKRDKLVSVLKEQYKSAQIDVAESQVLKNIEHLVDSDTFTITTGQQIHIGLGPLYVIYKIWDVLAITKKLNEEYADYNFVPVFWMASEDHDLEEIQSVNLYGKTFTWETDQVGPVGRMSTGEVAEVFERIESEFRLDQSQLEFIERCKNIYRTSDNLSQAFLRLLHSYLGKTGLVILDADNAALKEIFSPVLKDELVEKNYDALKMKTERLEALGHERQLLIRECNVFDMSGGDRIKVNPSEGSLAAEVSAYNLSPNAALRPLYQEWVLPNLLYVGGGAEVKYWMQLKGLFDNYKLQMPIVSLRTSWIQIPEKYKEKIEQVGLETFFGGESALLESVNDEYNRVHHELDRHYQSLLKALDNYVKKAEDNLSGFSLSGKLKKIKPKLSDLKNTVDEYHVKQSQNSKELTSLNKIRQQFFGGLEIQERATDLIAYPDLLHHRTVLETFKFDHRSNQTELFLNFR